MALAFRSATEAGTGSAATSLAINVPSGVQDGDHLVLFGVTADGDDGGFDALSGWVEEIGAEFFNTGGSAPSPPGMSVWRRIASSEPASYTITPSFGSTGIAAKMVAFSGGDPTTQWDVAETTATGDGTNADPPSITPTTDGAITVVAAFWDSTTTVWSAAPSGYTDSGGLGSVTGNGGGNGCTCAIAHRNSVIDPAAAENPAAFTSSAEQWGAVTVALRPAAVGITSVTPDEFDMDEADVDVASTGAAFDASGNDVYLSDADTLAGSANEVDVSSAVNTEATTLINLDFTQLSAGELSSLHTLGPGARYVIVDATGGEYSWPVTLHRPIAFVMSLSSEFAPGATTQRLTGLTGTFAGGRIEEAANPSATTTNVATDGNREDVWNIQATVESREVAYVARVLYGGNVPDTITQTPTVTVTAAVDYDLVAAGGVYTLSGTAAGLEHHAALDAAAGSYAVSGQDATLDLDRLIGAAAGAYALTGQDAALERAALLDAAAGAYALTGQAAGLELAALIDAAAGAYALTGTAAELVYSIKLAAEGGAYALTGQDAGFLRDVILVAAGGAYALSGQAAGLEYHRLLGAAPGAYALTGQDADLVTAVSLVAEGGAYALTGQDAGFLQDVILVAEGGAYDLAGQAALLEYHRLMAAAGGAYALTGSDANLVTAVALTAEGGAYALTGQAAGLIRIARLDAAAGAYDLTGQAAGLIRPSDLQAAGGAYALTGSDAGLDLLRLLAGAGGAYAWSGQDAGFLVQALLQAGAGVYLLVGFDAGLDYSLGTIPGEVAMGATGGHGAGMAASRGHGAVIGGTTGPGAS